MSKKQIKSELANIGIEHGNICTYSQFSDKSYTVIINVQMEV